MIRVKTSFNKKPVVDAATRASVKNLQKGAFAVRKDAQASVQTSGQPSTPGSPPNTKKGQFLKSILYAVDAKEMSAVIGPSVKLMSDAGRAHEKGGVFRGQRYPKRATMVPALQRKLGSFAGLWSDSVK